MTASTPEFSIKLRYRHYSSETRSDRVADAMIEANHGMTLLECVV